VIFLKYITKFQKNIKNYQKISKRIKEIPSLGIKLMKNCMSENIYISSVILYKDVSALLFTFGIIVHSYSLHSSLSRVCYPIWTLRKLDTHRFLGNKEDKLKQTKML
jgi:hypothetical protein